LTQIGRPAFWPLVDAVAASNPGEHWEPYRVLHGFSVDLVEDYAVALGHASPWVRLAAAIRLNRLGPDALPAAPALVARLDDPDPDVREQVIFALKYIGDGVIPALQEVRAHGPGHLRASALTALAEVGGEAALRPEDRAALERLLRIKLLNERAESVGGGLCGVWLAIPGGDQQAIMQALDLTEQRLATMRLGFAVISSDRHGGGTFQQRDSRVFITPQLDGWTLVVGGWYARWGTPKRQGDLEVGLGIDPATEIEVVRELSARFGQAQSYRYDGQFGSSDYLVCVDGEICRYYNWSKPELSIGERLPVEESMRLPHEEARIPEEGRAALDALLDECLGDLDRYFERQREVYDRYGVPPICDAFDIAAAMSVSPTKLGPQTEVVGHGLIALTPAGREHGVPTRGAFPI
jgi:hypothetical protein